MNIEYQWVIGQEKLIALLQCAWDHRLTPLEIILNLHDHSNHEYYMPTNDGHIRISEEEVFDMMINPNDGGNI